MSQGDDGAPKRPASANMPAAPPRPKPPVPTAAKEPPPPPPAHEANPFLARESSRDIDVGWLTPEDAAEVSVVPAEPDAPPNDPGATAGPAEQAPAPESPQVEKRSRAKMLSLVLVAALVLVGGGFVYQSQVTARSSKVERAAPQPSAEATVEPPPPATVPPPPPTHTAEPPPSASAEKKKAVAGAGAGGSGAGAQVSSASADPASQGILDTMQLPAGRKIIVDGRVVGTSPRRVAVRCGVHRIQIGDLPPESITLPCGGEVSFTD